MATNDLNEGIDYVSPRILSKEASNEILGENLCLLIAVGKNGKVVRFLPYGVEETPVEFDSSDEETTCLEISIKVPKASETSNMDALLGAAPSRSVARAPCTCTQAGVSWKC
jgi:hypothetical protein